jgi:NAD(P)H-dependent FMN reductase
MGDGMWNLKIILGTTRPTRAVDLVHPWVVRRANAHGAFEVDVLDLRDWPLPPFQEHAGSIGDFNDPTYSEPIVREWNRKIKEADAVLIVTAEYLHSIPGTLKNALDNIFVSFALRNKPLAAVGYSGGIAAGTRAVEHLMAIAIEAEMAPLRQTVLIPKVGTAFDADDNPIDPGTDIAMTVMLDDLAWWTALLATGRAQGELPPAVFRMQAALAARQTDSDQ